MSGKATMVEDKHAPKRYKHEPDHKRKNSFRKSCPTKSNPTFKKKENCCVWKIELSCTTKQSFQRENTAEGDDIILAVVSQFNLMTNVSK